MCHLFEPIYVVMHYHLHCRGLDLFNFSHNLEYEYCLPLFCDQWCYVIVVSCSIVGELVNHIYEAAT